VPAAPTADEDLSTKPAAQIAFREAYASGYCGWGAAPAIALGYTLQAQRYRDLYYRLHAEVDGPVDRVRRAVTEGGSDNALLVRTSDHGDLLGAHGGLHQKWFNLYDEATRVPFVIARIGEHPTAPRVVAEPTSHVDLVPTLLAAAGLDAAGMAGIQMDTVSLLAREALAPEGLLRRIRRPEGATAVALDLLLAMLWSLRQHPRVSPPRSLLLRLLPPPAPPRPSRPPWRRPVPAVLTPPLSIGSRSMRVLSRKRRIT
jgi:hypothetical protein